MANDKKHWLAGALGGDSPAQTAGSVRLGPGGQSASPQSQGRGSSALMQSTLAKPPKPVTVSQASVSAPQASVAAPQAPAGPSRSPTGFVGFNQYMGANAGAAKASADRVAKAYNDQTERAMQALQGSYGAFQDKVQGGVNDELAKGYDSGATYGGPNEYNPDENTVGSVTKANEQRSALGSVGGVQGLLGPQSSRWGAGLVQAAGAPQFAQAQKDTNWLATALGDAQRTGNEEAAQARQTVEQRMAPQAAPEGWADYQRYLDSIRQSAAESGMTPPTYEAWLAERNGQRPASAADQGDDGSARPGRPQQRRR